MSFPYPNDGRPSATFPLYSRGNMGEAFPNVISPMTGSLMLEASTRAQTRWFVETGALSKQQVNDPANAMFVQFYGYLYANASLARIAAVRAPGVRVDDIDAQYGGVGVLPPYQPLAAETGVFSRRSAWAASRVERSAPVTPSALGPPSERWTPGCRRCRPSTLPPTPSCSRGRARRRGGSNGCSPR